MIRGFVSGVIWGSAVSALGLGAISQLTPLPVARIAADATAVQVEKPVPADPAGGSAQNAAPDAQAAQTDPAPGGVGDADALAQTEPAAPGGLDEFDVDAAAVDQLDPAADAAAVDQLDPPAGSEFAKPLPDLEPVLPAPDAGPQASSAASGPLTPPAPDAASINAAPSPVPATGLAPAAPMPQPSAGDSPDVATATDDAGQSALADPVQPAAPQTDAPPAPTPDPPQPDATPAPQPAPQDVVPDPAAKVLAPNDLPAPDPVLPAQTVPPTGADDAPGDTNSGRLAPTPGLNSAVDGVTVGRLPRIGDDTRPGAATEGSLPTAPDAAAGADAPAGPDGGPPPLRKFARQFDNPDAKPLFSIILIDTGGAALDREALAALPFAVTFALDPLSPDAADASRIYRAAGQEVIMVATGIPAGATASDLEVTFQAHASALPEAVAVIDTEFGAFQADRPLATQVVPILKAQGRGLISWDRGLNAADQVARREGLAATLVFRKLDGNGETSAAVRRALDRAAFKAAQDGRVTVIGQTIPETVAALTKWAADSKAADVAIAPVSAVLTTQ